MCIGIFTSFSVFLGNLGGEDRFFQFTVLPFGLATAGHIFTKVMRCLVQHWRRASINILVYLDDGLGIDSNYQSAVFNSHRVRSDIVKSGFVFNVKKSTWQPTSSLAWLGIEMHLKEGYICVPETKVRAVLGMIDRMLAHKRTTYRSLAGVVGRLISMSVVLGDITHLMLRFSHVTILNRSCWDAYFELPVAVLQELTFWKGAIANLNVRKLFNPVVIHRMVYSDVSDSGCGGYIVNIDNTECIRSWSPSEAKRSSSWRELKAVVVILESVGHLLKDRNVRWYTDNQAIVSIVNKGSMRMHLHVLALAVRKLCISNNLNLFMEWIPRSLNDRADYLSRVRDIDDWRVSRQFFKFIDELWGPHTVDRFANDRNAQLPRFNSLYWSPGSEGVDAFAFRWSGENNWLVPPISNIIACVNYLLINKAPATLIVPRWRSAVYWPLLVDEHGCFPNFIVDFRLFRNSLGIFENGSVPSIFGDTFRSPVLALRINKS